MIRLKRLWQRISNKLSFHHLNMALLEISTAWHNDYSYYQGIVLRKQIDSAMYEVGYLQDDVLYLASKYVNQAEINLIRQYCLTHHFTFNLVNDAYDYAPDKAVALSDEQWSQVLDDMNNSTIKAKIQRQLN